MTALRLPPQNDLNLMISVNIRGSTNLREFTPKCAENCDYSLGGLRELEALIE